MTAEYPYDHILSPDEDETSTWSDTLIATPAKPADKVIFAHHRFARATSAPVPADAAPAEQAATSSTMGATATHCRNDQRDLLLFPAQPRPQPQPDRRAQAVSLSEQRFAQESPVTEQGPPAR